MQTVDTLITARWILPVAPGGGVLEDAAVAIHHGRIEAVAPRPAALAAFQADELIERPQHVLLPGLINAHVHSPLSLLRGLAEDCPPSSWRGQHVGPAERRWLSAEFVNDGTLLAVAEMLHSGITCFADSYAFPDVIAKCAADHGMRAVVGLPVSEAPDVWAESVAEHIAKGTEVHDRYREHPLISCHFALQSANGLADETLRRVRVLADQLELPISLHAHETADEIQLSRQAHERRPLARLEALGLLTPSLLAAHATHLDGADVDLLARSGAHVVHCPEANLKLGNGSCPLTELLAAHVNVALGTESAAANNDLDVLGELRTAVLLAKGHAADARLLPAERAIELATINAARALGLQEQTGSLEPGKWADICCIDLARPATQPVHDVPSTIVYAAGRDQVSDVWVAGRQLLAEGRLRRLDAEAIIATAQAWRQRIHSTQAVKGPGR